MANGGEDTDREVGHEIERDVTDIATGLGRAIGVGTTRETADADIDRVVETTNDETIVLSAHENEIMATGDPGLVRGIGSAQELLGAGLLTCIRIGGVLGKDKTVADHGTNNGTSSHRGSNTRSGSCSCATSMKLLSRSLRLPS